MFRPLPPILLLAFCASSTLAASPHNLEETQDQYQHVGLETENVPHGSYYKCPKGYEGESNKTSIGLTVQVNREDISDLLGKLTDATVQTSRQNFMEKSDEIVSLLKILSSQLGSFIRQQEDEKNKIRHVRLSDRRNFRAHGDNGWETWSPAGALDGNLDYPGFHSKATVKPWMAIDMGGTFEISKIRFFIRGGDQLHRFRDIKVYLTKTLDLSGNYDHLPLFASFPGTASQTDIILPSINGPMVGEVIIIQISNASIKDAILELLEVYVY